MNRHDRRAKRAQERKGRRRPEGIPVDGRLLAAMPGSLGDEGRQRHGGAKLPQRYFDDISEAAQRISDWVQQQPTRPELRWVEQKNDGVLLTGNLDVAAHYLADSPDAFRLLEWLDEATGRKLSLYQATWALRMCRAIPMPDGSYYGVEEKTPSAGLRMLHGLVNHGEKGAELVHHCPHCGKLNDHATGEDADVKPQPGSYTICFSCTGVGRFDEQMQLVKVTDDDIAALPESAQAMLDDARSMLRTFWTSRGTPQGATKGEA